MSHRVCTSLLVATALVCSTAVRAEPLDYVGKPVRDIPVSNAVKAGKLVFVSGTPGYGKNGTVAVGDFGAQMKQVMDNIAATLKTAGADWSRVVKTTVFLMRATDFADMNRIYSTYFTNGAFPARTTEIVAGLPSADFLLEIECEAVIE